MPPPRAWLVLTLLFAACQSVGFVAKDTIPWESFPSVVADKRVVVVGERHARVEPIETVKYLISQRGEKTRFTHLVAEWPESDQAALDAFLAGDEGPWKRMIANSAGLPGATEEYFSLYAFVREFNRSHPDAPVRVCLMDVKSPVHSTASEARDQNMFRHIRRILDENPRNRALVYVGSAHAAKTGSILYSGGDNGDVPLPTLGSLLASAYPDAFCSAAVLVPSDPAWSAGAKDANHAAKVIRLDERSGTVGERVKMGTRWRPAPPGAIVNAQAVFDYLVWLPKNTPARRVAYSHFPEKSAPVVIQTMPETGGRDLPFGEVEITVTFSKEMADRSWAWCIAPGFATPETIGQPRYTADHRTCVLKVRLKPGTAYGYWLNTPRFRDFRDTEGHPAVPYLLTFTTMAESAARGEAGRD